MHQIEQINEFDIPIIRTILEENQLSVEEDISSVLFFCCKEGKDIISTGGVEIFGKNALIRSIAVRKNHRRKKLGLTMVSHLENYLKSKRVNHAYLLTETAALFFKTQGYQEYHRRHAPIAIQQSTQFSSICPSSALLLHKHL